VNGRTVDPVIGENMPRNREKITHDAWGDAVYEVWRSGGNSDLVDYERVRDDVSWGADRHEAAENETHRVLRRYQTLHWDDFDGQPEGRE